MALGSVVVCLGEALIDRLGPPGGDPAVDQPVDDRLGGAPANVACGLASLGTPVAFAGRLGQDAIGEAFSKLFVERGVETALLQRDAERPSRIVLVRRSLEGERQFQGFDGDQGAGFADQASGAGCFASGPMVVDWHPSVGSTNVGFDALLSAVRQARSQGTAIALDVNWRPTFWDATADPDAGPDPKARRRPIQPLAGPGGSDQAGSGGSPLVVQHRRSRCNTAGLAPATRCGGHRWSRAPVRWQLGADSGQQVAFQPPVVVDTTGAGDAFTAGLLHRWAAAPQERIRFAAACGALVCGGAGGIDPQPTQAQVEAFLGEVS